MASSIVHLAITNEIMAILDFNNTDRLKFGSVVVDSGYGGNSHLKIHILDGQKKTYDFDQFRQLFGERMLVDDLYLGYYLHLVQDALFRQFVYNKYHWNPTIPGNVERLHKDYSIVNYYVVTKYHLHNDLVVPDGFEHEAINQICSFDTEGLLMSMDSYFLPVEEEPIFFFTKEMSDEFIEGAIDFCVQEIEKIRRGETGIDMVAYAWNRVGLPVDESPKYDSVSVSEVKNADEKQRIAREILEALPDWFGIPESREQYIKESADQAFFVAYDSEKPIGFLCLKETGKETVELCVMGVLKEYHRQGIGRKLFEQAREAARQSGYLFMQVKTVQMGRYEDYDNTNRFYLSLGFKEFEVFPTLWDEWNPCQVYVMAL